jgi:hypothetical protein
MLIFNGWFKFFFCLENDFVVLIEAFLLWSIDPWDEKWFNMWVLSITVLLAQSPPPPTIPDLVLLFVFNPLIVVPAVLFTDFDAEGRASNISEADGGRFEILWDIGLPSLLNSGNPFPLWSFL